MAAPTIVKVINDSNQLFTGLKDTLSVDLTIPDLGDTNMDIPLPSTDPNTNPAYAPVEPLTLDALTTVEIDGDGVFDRLMTTFNLHMDVQAQKNRITGKEYAEVYLGGVQNILAQSVGFLLQRDTAYWQALAAQAAVQTAQVGLVTAQVNLVSAKYEAVSQKLNAAKVEVDAYTAQAAYANGKINLDRTYTEIVQADQQAVLLGEQIDIARLETKSTTTTGGAFAGKGALTLQTMTAQLGLSEEQLDTARAQTKNTLSDGTAVAGLVGLQIEAQEKQNQQIDAQIRLIDEQVDTARSQTKETLVGGSPVAGIQAVEKTIKTKQALLVAEQYEAARGQTRGTLSTGEVIVGTLGAQRGLLLQQVESYKQDAQSKAVKMMLDTWTARKSLDDGVAVPVQIDTAAIDASMAIYRRAVGVTP